MKKIVVWAVILTFGLSLVALAPAGAEEMEKILSPDQIKNYRVMQKIGNTLYGIRIEAKRTGEALREKAGKEESASSGSAGQNSETTSLEKISAPHLVSMYEKIKRVGNALWGVKKDGAGSQKRQSAVVSAEAASCVATAISIKDKALGSEVGTMAQGVQAAIDTRSACQQAAVKVTENQRAEIEACTKTFRDSQRQLAETYKKSHLQTWEAYKASLKVCQPSSSSNEAANQELVIEDGSDNSVESLTDVSQE